MAREMAEKALKKKTAGKSTLRRRRASKTPEPKPSTSRPSRSKTPQKKSKVSPPGTTSEPAVAVTTVPGPSIAFNAQSFRENPLIWASIALAVVTAVVYITSPDLWQLRPVPFFLVLVAVWFGYGTSDFYCKYLAVCLVWHTALETLLAMADAKQGGCEGESESDCRMFVLGACVLSHLALAYGNKKPHKSADSGFGLAGSVLLCGSDMVFVLEQVLEKDDLAMIPPNARFVAACVASLVLAFSAMMD